MKRFSLLMWIFAISVSAQTSNWTMWRGNSANTGASPQVINLPLITKYTISSPLIDENGVVVVEGVLYVTTSDGQLHAYEVETGMTLPGFPVQVASGRNLSSPVYGDNKIFVHHGADGKIYAFNAVSGERELEPMSAGTTQNPRFCGPVVAEGKIYAGGGDGYLYAFDISTGQPISGFPVAVGGDDYGSSPAITNGKVYFNSSEGIVYAFDANNGDAITGFPVTLVSTALQKNRTINVPWQTTLGVNASSLTVVDGKIYVFAGDDKLYCLNAGNGQIISGFPVATGGSSLGYFGSPAVANEVVYIFCHDGQLYAYDTINGAVMDGFPVSLNPDGFLNFSSPTVNDSLVFVGAGETKTWYAVGAANTPQAGKIRWSQKLASNDDRGFSLCSPVLADGLLFLTICNGSIYIIENNVNWSGGSLLINNGDAKTTTQEVQLTLNSGTNTLAAVDSMIVSDNPLFTGIKWEKISTTKNWMLGEGSGSYTVYARFKDLDEKMSEIFSDDIILGMPLSPVSGLVAAPLATDRIELNWINPSTTDWKATCILRKTDGFSNNSTDGTIIYNGRGTTFTDTGLIPSTAYYYTAFAYDVTDAFAEIGETSKVMATTNTHSQSGVLVTDDILSDAHWTKDSSPYRIEKNIFVANGATLTIDPGVIVKLIGFALISNGKINAVGTETDTIIFTSGKASPAPMDWNQIILDGVGSYNSEFKYCKIQYARVGVSFQNSNSKISHSIIENGQDGILNNTGIAIIENNIIHNMIQCGIAAGDGNPIILNNKIFNCWDGIITDYANSTIINNIIYNNSRYGIDNRNANSASAVSRIINNTLDGNGILGTGPFGANINCDGSSPIIKNNIITNSTNNVGAGHGAGIRATSGGAPIISNNNVWNNQGGNYTVYNSGSCSPGSGDISSDPLFINRAVANYHLRDTSPCIGAASFIDCPTSDFEGNHRENPPDIGAFEYSSQLQPIQYTVTLSANPKVGGAVQQSGTGTYNSGSSVTVTATANNGYILSNWTENGIIIQNAGATYTFTLRGNRNLVANFTSGTKSVSYLIPRMTNQQPPPLKLGDEWYIDIIIGDSLRPVQDLWAISATIDFSGSHGLIEVVEEKAEDFMGSGVFFSANRDNVGDSLEITLCRCSEPVGISGTGVIARIKFRNKQNIPSSGSIMLSMHNIRAIDAASNPIPLLESNFAVPVELSSFNAILVGREVYLQWRTESETNNYGFEIEKMISTNWQKIGFVPGYGTISIPQDYFFSDLDVKPGQLSYRLKQIDTDGRYIYSQPVRIELMEMSTSFLLLHNYPNPFNPSTTIEFTLPLPTHVSLRVYSVLGKQVAILLNEQMPAGMHKVVWNAGDLANGVYYYVLQAGNYREVRKAILMK